MDDRLSKFEKEKIDKKIAAVERYLAEPKPDRKPWPWLFRDEWLEACNQALIAAMDAGHHVGRLYDPRSYEEAGVEVNPGEHLGPERTARERKGWPTRAGARNRIRQILKEREDEVRRIERELGTAGDVVDQAYSPDLETRIRAFDPSLVESGLRLLADFRVSSVRFFEMAAAEFGRAAGRLTAFVEKWNDRAEQDRDFWRARRIASGENMESEMVETVPATPGMAASLREADADLLAVKKAEAELASQRVHEFLEKASQKTGVQGRSHAEWQVYVDHMVQERLSGELEDKPNWKAASDVEWLARELNIKLITGWRKHGSLAEELLARLWEARTDLARPERCLGLPPGSGASGDKFIIESTRGVAGVTIWKGEPTDDDRSAWGRAKNAAGAIAKLRKELGDGFDRASIEIYGSLASGLRRNDRGEARWKREALQREAERNRKPSMTAADAALPTPPRVAPRVATDARASSSTNEQNPPERAAAPVRAQSAPGRPQTKISVPPASEGALPPPPEAPRPTTVEPTTAKPRAWTYRRGPYHWVFDEAADEIQATGYVLAADRSFATQRGLPGRPMVENILADVSPGKLQALYWSTRERALRGFPEDGYSMDAADQGMKAIEAVAARRGVMLTLGPPPPEKPMAPGELLLPLSDDDFRRLRLTAGRFGGMRGEELLAWHAQIAKTIGELKRVGSFNLTHRQILTEELLGAMNRDLGHELLRRGLQGPKPQRTVQRRDGPPER